MHTRQDIDCWHQHRRPQETLVDLAALMQTAARTLEHSQSAQAHHQALEQRRAGAAENDEQQNDRSDAERGLG